MAPTTFAQAVAPAHRGADAHPKWIGDWRILTRLGEGGMGVVYLAERMGVEAAVKVLKPRCGDDGLCRDRFMLEAQLTERVTSSNVVRHVESGLDHNPPYLATEYEPGLTLHDHVAFNGPLQGNDLEQFAQGLAAAMADIHVAGAVHRDLKPSNVLMTARGPVVIDLGIASTMHEPALTREGIAVGSPGWLSPEQVRGDEVTHLADSFAWASVVQFAATGDGPFGEGRSEALLYRVLHGKPRDHEISGPLGVAVSAALRKDPSLRPSMQRIASRGFSDISVGCAHGSDAHAAIEPPLGWLTRADALRLVACVAVLFALLGFFARGFVSTPEQSPTELTDISFATQAP